VEILSKQKITGKSLLTLTEEKLLAAPYNLPGGPAAELVLEIQKLSKPSGTFLYGAVEIFADLSMIEKTNRFDVTQNSVVVFLFERNFQSITRRHQIQQIFETVLLPNFKAQKEGRILDKKAWTTQFIHDQSGIGKTQFILELLKLPLLEDVLYCPYEMNPFLEFFQRGLRVYLSSDNPLQVHSSEQPLMEEFTVGAKVNLRNLL